MCHVCVCREINIVKTVADLGPSGGGGVMRGPRAVYSIVNIR